MQEKVSSVGPDIVALIKRTVAESMKPFGLKSVDVRAGEDHDGDPVIFVEARYDLSETPIDPAVTARLTSVLRDRLWAAGETRFPHTRHKYHEQQKVKARRRAGA
jgi:hypothetical protein